MTLLLMDIGCKFGQEYLPIEDQPDPVVQTHVENCKDCQREVALL